MKTKRNIQKTRVRVRQRKNTQKNVKKRNHQKGGEELLVDFSTMKNTGRTDDMSNQCFWISLCDFLNNYLETEEKITVNKLRTLVENENLPLNCKTEMFDYESHKEALKYISEMYNLKITIYDVDDKNKIDIIERNATFGVENGMPIHIAFYPYGHFELITKIDGATVLPARADTTIPLPSVRGNTTRKNRPNTPSSDESKHSRTQKKYT